MANESRINKLAKLIHPILIITGFDEEERNWIFGDYRNSPLLSYRKYGKTSIPLNIFENLSFTADFI